MNVTTLFTIACVDSSSPQRYLHIIKLRRRASHKFREAESWLSRLALEEVVEVEAELRRRAVLEFVGLMHRFD